MVLQLDSPQTEKAGKPSSSPLEESTGIIGKLNKEILSEEQNQALRPRHSVLSLPSFESAC